MNRNRLFILFLMISMLVSGCSTLRNINRKDECEKNIKAYSRMMRWLEPEKAGISFVDEKRRPEFDRVVESFRRRNVSVADYRILAYECLPGKKRAEATVEYDYFVMPDLRMKTVTERQVWVYREEDPVAPDLKTGWVLTSAVPVFE